MVVRDGPSPSSNARSCAGRRCSRDALGVRAISPCLDIDDVRVSTGDSPIGCGGALTGCCGIGPGTIGDECDAESCVSGDGPTGTGGGARGAGGGCIIDWLRVICPPSSAWPRRAFICRIDWLRASEPIW